MTQGPVPPGEPPRRPFAMNWLRLAIMLVVVAFVWTLVSPTPTTDEVAYATFLRLVAQDRVTSVSLDTSSGTIAVTRSDGKTFTTQGPPGGLPDADLALLRRHDVDRTYVSAPSTWFGTVVLYLLPVALLIGFFVWMSRRGAGQLGMMSAFGRSHARIQDPEAPSTTFSDVAGYDAVKQEIGEVVGFLKDPERFQRMGARIPKGMLLVGPPGTGKTLFARAVAGEAGVPFFSMNASEFLEMFVGVGAARVRDLFATARKSAPSIIFVDEIDAIGRRRGGGGLPGHEEREQTLNQLLAEMDGFEASQGIVVLAATNRPDVLDPALLRAGRFDRQVVIPLPTQEERLEILRVHSRSKLLDPDVDLALVARATPGMSGADLANLLNEAALFAVRRDEETITQSDIDDARDRILMGLQRPSLALSPQERDVVAHHEAGHAVLAQLLEHADPVHKVTILPTGLALGATQQLPEREHVLRLRADLDDELAVLLGGNAAEQLVFGDVSTGAHDDLVRATELAGRMVREWGMSAGLGTIAWRAGGGFLGDDVGPLRDYSEETARVIDAETKAVLERQAQRATAVLTAHRAALDAVAGALLAEETISGERVEQLVQQATASVRPVA